MEKINLEEILIDKIGKNTIEVSKTAYKRNGDPRSLFDKYVESMKEACKQILELAAENAELMYFELKEDWMEEPFNSTIDDLGNIYAIDKQSILDTINQIE